MAKFLINGSLADFQKIIWQIYGRVDDRMFSLHDLISNMERFCMRSLKGIRKQDKDKCLNNLLISFSWLMAICNRLHIDAEKAVYQRFPGICSYCGQLPCKCSRIKPAKRKADTQNQRLKPGPISEIQNMFAEIYPPSQRTLEDAGIHLAEETGEISEAVHCYLGEHKASQFRQIEEEAADWISCAFGVANSAGTNVAGQLSAMYKQNCHECHQLPCKCNFSYIAEYNS